MGPLTSNEDEIQKPEVAEGSDSDDDDFVPLRSFRMQSTSKQKKSDTKRLRMIRKSSSTNKKNCDNDIPWNDCVQQTRECHNLSYASHHIIHYIRNMTQGTQPPFQQNQALNTPVMNTNKALRIHKTYQGFDRRATAVAWHPKNPNVVAVGSKGGDIILWNYENDGDTPRMTIRGGGPGFSIQAMKFDEWSDSRKLFTVSIDGALALNDLLGGTKEEYLGSAESDWSHWYTSLDVSVPGKVIIVGDNKGVVRLLTPEGETLWTEKLHKQKVTHIEFCPRMQWCLVTASTDRTLKVWDIRNMKPRNSCLHTFNHERPINSAHFSRTDGGMLVTTDQHSEIRVYNVPSFKIRHTIPHPHRQFQHLTPIKATWHPLRDIIVVGRYPDPQFPGYMMNEPRTIDFFDAPTGNIIHQHQDKGYSNKIVSLNLFNHSGDRLLSCAGMFVWVWKPKFEWQKKKKRDTKGKDDSDGNSSDEDDEDEDDDDDQRKKPRRRQNTKKNVKRKLNSEEGAGSNVVRGIMKIDRPRHPSGRGNTMSKPQKKSDKTQHCQHKK